MAKSAPSLAERYDLSVTRVFLSGPQALVRLALTQSELDRRAGLNTAGYVTGYRGSPVGTVDTHFVAAQGLLEPRNIKFEAALNEDLAATALWGTQQAEMRGEGRFDGVFGIWYGKGPGVDRSGDVFRHVNMAGSSKHGGVIVVAGDDHSGESSTVVHASDWALSDAMFPVLSPAGVQEVIEFGLFGFALSRYAGVWVGLKSMHDTIESSATIDAPLNVSFKSPMDHALPPGGLNIRPRDDRVPQEERLHMHKIPAVHAFARANGIDKVVWSGGKRPRIGIAAAGKNYLDARQALDDLGIDEARAARLGIRLIKIGMVWPLEPGTVESFAAGLETVIVVEEKRSLIEAQMRDILFNAKKRPVIVGKNDELGKTLFPPHGVLEPHRIAAAIAARIKDQAVAACAHDLQASLPVARNQAEIVSRIPYFCAGCPHNSSTVLPEGARGYAGIGCHWLAQFVPDRKTEGATQMGGEGANWVGEAPFSTRPHMFQNLGDGTYNHSGLMAIRHAVKAGVNITYKILFNDAVAMTGGQLNDGGLTVPNIAQQMRAIGVERIAVVHDEDGKQWASAFPAHVTFNHRDDLQDVQKELQGVSGTSVLIYDQTCAAEKRRRRRKGLYPDPNKRVFINERVCEGCGDCGVQSNCVAIVPVETPFGRKRQIDQSVCNKDFSCVKGFCPSFVTVEGADAPKRRAARDPASVPFPVLPEPSLPSLARPWSILVAGIGGTGVVTIGHLLGQAAHIEGKGAALIDMVGISQKNGSVVTHVKFSASPSAISAVRIADGQADVLFGCDLVTAATARVLDKASRRRTAAIINGHETMTGDFTRAPDFDLHGDALRQRIGAAAMSAQFVEATELATSLMGDSIASNLFMLGFAYQKGLIPVGEPAIAEAVRLNGVAVKMNLDAFAWGRRRAADEVAFRAVIGGKKPETPVDYFAELTAYQSRAYAEQHAAFVALVPDRDLADAVARNLYKLMAYKDEYEVARLLTLDGKRGTFHLAPPFMGNRKRQFGPWMLHVFRLLTKLRGLRGTAFDPFGRTAERKQERQLIDAYKVLIEGLLPKLSPRNRATILGLASLPDQIRGFGHIKAESIRKAEAREAELLAALDGRKLEAAE